jgi:tetratricopeptide (TPR) repeat protein
VVQPSRSLYSFFMLVFSRLILFFLINQTFWVSASPISANVKEIEKQAERAQASDHLNEAIALYQKAVRLDPAWMEGWWSLGSILYDQDRFPEAETAFHRFVALSPRPGPGYAFLGLCEYETRDYDQALQQFRTWATKGWTGTTQLIDVAVFHFALLLTRDGRFVPALYLLSAEIEKSYSGPGLIEGLGLASLRMRQVPEDYPPEQREAVWLAGKAAYYAAIHPTEFGKADEFAHRLSVHYDRTPNVHYFLGTLCRMKSDYAGAVEEYQKELQISPKNAAAIIALSRLAFEDNRQDEAMVFAQHAVELDPNNPENRSLYGEILLKAGKTQESVQQLQTAKQFSPDSASIRFLLAAAYRKLHRKSEADRETAAFNLLKDKENVAVSPEEKLKEHPELLK